MYSALRTISVVALLLTVWPLTSWAADAPGKSDTLKWAEARNAYVGTNGCKLCHKLQYDSWAKTSHASAWSALKPEEQAKPECAECHMVGRTKADSAIVDVGCEACHGPGSGYRNMKTMKDKTLAAAAGLLPITEATCVRCHNTRSPQFKSFDYAKALATGIHEHKPRAATK